jgi:hypothetical protein
MMMHGLANPKSGITVEVVQRKDLVSGSGKCDGKTL